MTVVEEQGTVAFVNDAAQRLTGHPEHAYIGRSFVDLVHVEEQGRVREAFGLALATCELTQAVQFRLRAHDGQWVWIESRMRAVRDGAARSVLIYSRDVGTTRQLDERLRHAKKLNLLGRLAVGITVDLEQVVATIRGHLPRIVELTAGQPASLSLHAILRATERAAALTRQMRALYETTPLLLEQIDVHALLGDVKRLTTDDGWLQLTLQARRTQVRTDWVALVLGLRDLILAFRQLMPEQNVVITTSGPPEAQGPVGFGAVRIEHAILEVTWDSQGASADRDTQAFERSILTPAPGSVMLALVTLDDIVNHSGGFIEVDTTANRPTAARIFLPVE
jgi:PAS domain S-box-containing protein